MFDQSEDGTRDAAMADDAVAVAAISASTRAEAAAAAQALSAIADLIGLRAIEGDTDPRQWWVIDGWTSICAEVACARAITMKKASGLMNTALALRHRLPRIATLFAQGRVSLPVVSMITWRTHLIQDDATLAAVDTALAAQASTYGALSRTKAEDAVDLVINAHDPDAVRRVRTAARGRGLWLGKPDDTTGTTSLWGGLSTPDAAILDQRLTQMSATVCDHDPRTLNQRRSDAVGALAHGKTRLQCRCTDPTCPAAVAEPGTVAVHIHVVTEPAALTAAPDPHTDGGADDDHADPPWNNWTSATEPESNPEPKPHTEPEPDAEPAHTRAMEPDAEAAPEPDFTSDTAADTPAARHVAPIPVPAETTPPAAEQKPPPAAPRSGRDQLLDRLRRHKPEPKSPRPPTALIIGGGMITAAQVGDLVRGGAHITNLRDFCTAAPEPHYRPSAALAAFIRARDLTCQFPHCTVPATRCDIDHVIPWPHGATHPSNLSCLCRTHHLLKTFWTGTHGWTTTHHRDGTTTWTTPTGHHYRTTPGSKLFFPTLTLPTGTAPVSLTKTPTPHRGLAIPKRRTTRATQRQHTIAAERALNRKLAGLQE